MLDKNTQFGTCAQLLIQNDQKRVQLMQIQLNCVFDSLQLKMLQWLILWSKLSQEDRLQDSSAGCLVSSSKQENFKQQRVFQDNQTLKLDGKLKGEDRFQKALMTKTDTSKFLLLTITMLEAMSALSTIHVQDNRSTLPSLN